MSAFERHSRTEDGVDLPYLVWRLPAPCRMVSSALLGGGIGPRYWVLNAQVAHRYDRLDPVDHLLELAERVGLSGDGVGLLTAADVGRAGDDLRRRRPSGRHGRRPGADLGRGPAGVTDEVYPPPRCTRRARSTSSPSCPGR
jgi:hypothetical protein